MAGDVATLASLVTDVKHSGWTVSPYPALYLASASEFFTLSTGSASGEVGKGVRLPSEADMIRLAGLLVPEPSADTPTWDAVAHALESWLEGSTPDPGSALTDLARLRWSDIWQAIDEMGRRGPSIEGETYLEMLDDKVGQLPDVDQRIRAALIVGMLMKGGRTLGASQVAVLVRLTQAILAIDDRSQLEVLGHLGIPPDAAEGTVAMMEAAVDSDGQASPSPPVVNPLAMPVGPGAVTGPAVAGVGGDWLSILLAKVAGIDPDAQTFLDWTKPQAMPYGLYMGTEVHRAIAAFYANLHLGHGNVMTNTWSVSSILNDLEVIYAFRGSPLKAALALARPDIFELGLVHGMPPGWVYEIKPASSAGLAEYEVQFYADALTLCDIPVIPGPPGMPGTEGMVPVPHGWAAFVAPMPGVIVYRVRRASKGAIEQRGQLPVNSDIRDKVESALKAAAATGAVVVAGATLAEAVAEFGWVLAFL